MDRKNNPPPSLLRKWILLFLLGIILGFVITSIFSFKQETDFERLDRKAQDFMKEATRQNFKASLFYNREDSLFQYRNF